MVAMKTRYTLNPSFSHLVGVAVILISLCIGIGRRVVFGVYPFFFGVSVLTYRFLRLVRPVAL